LLAASEVGTLVSDAGHGVHASDAYRDILVAELGGGGTEPFHESALFDVALPPVGDYEGYGPTDPRRRRPAPSE